MIKLVFTRQRETLTIEVENKIILYRDRKYKDGIQFMPKDSNLDMIVLKSRNKFPLEVVKWINDANQGKNLEEYQSAFDDEALIPIIIKDARLNGCVFQKRLDVQEKEKGELKEEEKNEETEKITG